MAAKIARLNLGIGGPKRGKARRTGRENPYNRRDIGWNTTAGEYTPKNPNYAVSACCVPFSPPHLFFSFFWDPHQVRKSQGLLCRLFQVPPGEPTTPRPPNTEIFLFPTEASSTLAPACPKGTSRRASSAHYPRNSVTPAFP